MRGGGRGMATSLTREQLQALDVSRNDNTAPVLTPPPLFPKLETKPLPLPSDPTTDYMLIIKDQFIETLHESPAYVKLRAKKDNIERYSDKYKLLSLDTKNSGTLQCVWENIPAELRPLSRGEKLAPRKRKIEDSVDIVKKLQTLEKKEVDESMQKPQEGKKDKDSDNEDLEEEQEQEYEVDEGTDYANNYFDNGDGYDDEDDNLDDDPVY